MEGFTPGNSTPFYESGTYLDARDILFTQHQTTAPVNGQTVPVTFTTVGLGTNFMTSPGNTASVSDVVVNTGYNPNGSTPDLAIAHLSTSLTLANQDPTSLTHAPFTFDAFVAGENDANAGFGVWGTPSTGLHLQDGNGRAITAPIVLNGSGFNNADYVTGNFLDDGSLGPMNGHGATLDSGSPWRNTFGNLVGISDAGSSTATIIESLSANQNWINQNDIMVAPEPNSGIITFIALASFVSSRQFSRLIRRLTVKSVSIATGSSSTEFEKT